MGVGRSVLVTGGNRGIGLAIARRFAADGDSVTVTSRSGEPIDGLTVVAVRRDRPGVRSTRRSRRWRRRTARSRSLVANAGITKDQLLR